MRRPEHAREQENVSQENELLASGVIRVVKVRRAVPTHAFNRGSVCLPRLELAFVLARHATAACRCRGVNDDECAAITAAGSRRASRVTLCDQSCERRRRRMLHTMKPLRRSVSIALYVLVAAFLVFVASQPAHTRTAMAFVTLFLCAAASGPLAVVGNHLPPFLTVPATALFMLIAVASRKTVFGSPDAWGAAWTLALAIAATSAVSYLGITHGFQLLWSSRFRDKVLDLDDE